MEFKRILVTGGAGFIGSSFIRYGLKHISCERIVNLDALTYAANLESVASCTADARYRFVCGDIRDQALVERLCIEEKIEAIVHFAAESHVDRSVHTPALFFETNVGGTLSLLEVVRRLPHIHFHHISTDEVYGSLLEGAFDETSPYRPNSPYAASKAASDHAVRAYGHTFGLSYTLSHCTNNYGPYQHEEKFIARMLAALKNKQPLPVYGTGHNVRDWIFVDDHSEAVWRILQSGKKSEVYDIGASCERSNLELLHLLIENVAQQTHQDQEPLLSLITFVPDRPGHDFRYAIRSDKIKRELQWAPRHTLEEGLAQTVRWFLAHENQRIVKSHD